MSIEETTFESPKNIDSLQKPKLVLNLKKLTFYSLFFLIFCFSGLLTMVSMMWLGIDYRMGLTTALVIPLIILYGIKVDRVVLAFAALTIVIILSGLQNNSSIREILLFMRIPIFSYLIYRLVDLYIRSDNITKIVQICILIGMIQLPLVVMQQLLYDMLPSPIGSNVIRIDFDFGTFNFKGDGAMSFFLILLIIFLLFDRKRNYIIRFRWFIVLWFTLTIFLANSENAKLIVLILWGIYFIKHLSIKTIIYFAVIFSIIIGALSFAGVFDEIWADFSRSVSNNIRIGSEGIERFETGRYSRGAAIYYYIERGLSLLGDGPSKYYEVITRTRHVGNTGHIFTFYGEVGLLGWLMSVLIFFFIAFPMRGLNIHVTWVAIMIFIAVQLLGFTNQILNNVSVVLIFCIIAKTYLIEPRSKLLPPTKIQI